MPARSLDRRMLDLAARLAWRARGLAEPNPTVGCVIARPDGRGGAEILGLGHTAPFGGPHAEAIALQSARARGFDLRAAWAWTTLEPCAHHGKTPPCAEALAEAGVARVAAARRDPHALAAGGMERLAAAGVEVLVTPASRAAVEASDPFVKRVTTGLPWVVAKWAQSVDGRIATRAGESKWISCERSRRLVHRVRSRVDAVLTAIGTVRADDPMLTARDVRRVRRVAARVVIDPACDLPPGSALARTAAQAPTICMCAAPESAGTRASALRALGVEVLGVPAPAGELDLRAALAALGARSMTNVLVESGPGLMGRLFRAGLIDEALVFVAPILLADDQALPALGGGEIARLADARRLELRSARRSGDDALLVLRARR